ncbi:MAG: hypothetical protein ACLSVD_09855 [Eggerthellaceae bacterium]
MTGSFVFAGHEDGRALLMGDEDVFAVAGIQLEPSELLSEWPDVVRTTLLPFDDLIVYDGMLNVLGIEFGPEVAASAQADFGTPRQGPRAHRCGLRRALARPQRGRSQPRRRASLGRRSATRVSPPSREQLPRASIAARSRGLRRPNALRPSTSASTRGMRGASSRRRPSCGSVPWTASRPARSRRAWAVHEDGARRLGRLLGLKGLSKLRKAELARAVGRASPRRPTCCAICWPLLPGAFRTAKELACEGAVSFGAEDVSRRLYLAPLMPYTFLFWQEGVHGLRPGADKCMLAGVDFEEIERVRVRNEVVTCAEACTTFYGVVSLDDAYLRYREACSDPVTRRRFVELIS